MRSENISERLEYSSKLDIWDGDLGMQERAATSKSTFGKIFSPDVDRC